MNKVWVKGIRYNAKGEGREALVLVSEIKIIEYFTEDSTKLILKDNTYLMVKNTYAEIDKLFY